MLNTALQLRAISAIDALRDAVLALQQAKIETASLDARLLLLHVLGISKEQFLSGSVSKLSSQQYAAYQDLVEQRVARRPLSQLVGKREFWDLTFKVTSVTLDPRPDSESLIEAVLAHIPDVSTSLKVLDLGTGTGCLLLTLLSLYEHASGTGVDISEAALEVAKANAKNLGLQMRSRFAQSSWGSGVEGTFDVIISNPPYIPTKAIEALAPEVRLYEPILALDGGEDGLDCYRIIMPRIGALLAKGGIAVFEMGMGQLRDVEAIATQNGLKCIGKREDMAGIPRCVIVSKQ